MLWKIYVWLFFAINAVSLVAFDYSNFSIIPFLSLILGFGLNVAAFSYAYKRNVLSKEIIIWIYKLNIGLLGLFLAFEVINFLQEIVGQFIALPVSGVVSLLASIPSLPALYATYKLAHPKASKSKKKSKKKA